MLIATSIGASVLCVATFAGLWLALTGSPRWVAVVPLVIILASVPFVVRSYEVTREALIIQRLFWKTTIPLDTLKTVEFMPKVMNTSFRAFGNGGLFSFTGWYYARGLGRYRAFVTDMATTVALRFEKGAVVVSPQQPEDFVRAVNATR